MPSRHWPGKEKWPMNNGWNCGWRNPCPLSTRLGHTFITNGAGFAQKPNWRGIWILRKQMGQLAKLPQKWDPVNWKQFDRKRHPSLGLRPQKPPLWRKRWSGWKHSHILQFFRHMQEKWHRPAKMADLCDQPHQRHKSLPAQIPAAAIYR